MDLWTDATDGDFVHRDGRRRGSSAGVAEGQVSLARAGDVEIVSVIAAQGRVLARSWLGPADRAVIDENRVAFQNRHIVQFDFLDGIP